MIRMIDPTYLRTMVDGLSSGALQKDNPSALPQGLVGVYEEAIPPASRVTERKKFLEFFSVWALMKKEVSAEFVASLLDGWSEKEVLAFIGRYSKWFNSPVSGVYTLYHERIRTFVLQKISGSQLRDINNRLIIACNDALTRRLNDEWERYALEYLSAHLLQPSLDNKERGSELKALAYNTNHWNRQIEVSKDFDWSKRLLNDMMLWASKYDEDQVIECALNKVDLHHMEQYDAPRIVELVAQNDIETALQRIEAFGGNDKEGLQRKFILYMLCLMELTLLDSKDKPFRKEAIEKLLKHLDESLPADPSILNWNGFFSSFLMFKMSCECAHLGLDYLIVYKRVNDWNSSWLLEEVDFMDEHFETLLSCARTNETYEGIIKALLNSASYIDRKGQRQFASDVIVEAFEWARQMTDGVDKNNLCLDLTAELAQIGRFKEAHECALEISKDRTRCGAIMSLCISLAKQGRWNQAFDLTAEIDLNFWKVRTLIKISNLLYVQGDLKNSGIILSQAKEFIKDIKDSSEYCYALTDLYIELASQGDVKEAIEFVRLLDEKAQKCRALATIARFMINKGLGADCEELIKECYEHAAELRRKESDILSEIAVDFAKCSESDIAFKLVGFIKDESEWDYTYKALAIEFGSLGMIDESLKSTNLIQDNDLKALTLAKVSTALHRRDRQREAADVMIMAMSLFDGCNAFFTTREGLLEDIIKELVSQKRFNDAQNYFLQEKREFTRRDIITALIHENLAYEDKFDSIRLLLINSLGYNDGFRSDLLTQNINSIGGDFIMQGKLGKALKCAESIEYYFDRVQLKSRIATEFYRNRKLAQAIRIAESFEIPSRSGFLKDLALIAVKMSRADDALEISALINWESYRDSYLSEVSVELAVHGFGEQAYKCCMRINMDSIRNETYSQIVSKLSENDDFHWSIQSALAIVDLKEKSLAQSSISIALSAKGRFNEAHSLASSIELELLRVETLIEISKNLQSRSYNEDSYISIESAIKFSAEITDVKGRIMALRKISLELFRQGMNHDSAVLIEEALILTRLQSDKIDEVSLLGDISTDMFEQGLTAKSYDVLQEAIQSAFLISKQDYRCRILISMAIKLKLLGKVLEADNLHRMALDLAIAIDNHEDKCDVLLSIARDLFQNAMSVEAYSLIQKSFDLIRLLDNNYWYKNSLIKNAVEIVLINGFIDDAINFAMELLNTEEYSPFKEIHEELIGRGDILKSMEFASSLIYNELKGGLLIESAIAFEAIGDYDNSAVAFVEAYKICTLMKNESSRDHDLYEIVVQLSQLQNLTAFKYFTSRIKNETYIDQMREILCEKLASKGEWTSAIEMASQIGDSGKRLWCYQIFGRLSASLIRNSDALNSVKSQISEEGLQHFLKGLVENVAISQCNINLALRLMPEIFNHDSLLEAFIGRYALNELFFGEVSNNKIERFKRTLNVNSALDIKNSFRAN